jgi:DnaJ-class molecular chaperone
VSAGEDTPDPAEAPETGTESTLDASAEAIEPQRCTVCRGTGTLISNLGGRPSHVTCAWCEGTGTFLPDHDAQAARRATATPPSDGPPAI